MSDSRHAPVMWTSPQPGFNTRDRERPARDLDGNAVVDDFGEPVIERHPQIGHVGDYDNRRRAKGVRYITTARHDGHVVFLPMTNGAAHLDPNTEFGQYQRAKMRHLGWFPIGSCPCALLVNDQLSAKHIIHRPLLAEQPCPPKSYSTERPCPHAKLEIAARRETWKRRQAELGERYKDQGSRQVEAINQQTEKLVEMLTAKAPATPAAGKKPKED